MALLWIEGFEGFGTATGVAPAPTGIIGRKYTVAFESFFDIESGRTGGRCIELIGNDASIRSSNLTTDATMVVGFAFKLSTTPSTSGLILSLYDSSVLGVGIQVNNTGGLEILRGTTILEVSTQVITPNTWYYIELKVVCSDTGSYEVRVNGLTWMSATSVDTKQGSDAYHTSFRLSTPPSNINSFFDDIYVLDGTAGLNDFLGPQRVIAINPDGDDTVTWDRSTGATNREVVDDGLLLDNTDYVSTGTTPEQDLYSYGDVPVDVSVVNGVQIITETNMEVGTFNLAAVVKSSTTESVGPTSTVIAGSDVTHVRVVEEDPDAIAPWTETTLNAAKFGVKATA